MTSILVIASLTLLASFLCSLFEAALYSITPSQLEVLKKQGSPGALRLARMREEVEEPIAAILTVNTIAHTIGASWCGAMVASEYGDGSGAVAIFAGVFTLLVLLLTEIVPKSIGVRFAPLLAPFVGLPIQLMIWASLPVARPAKWMMRKLTGGEGHAGPTEEEVEVFSSLAAKSGAMRTQEHRWVQNALRLDRHTAGGLRTPRTVVDTLPADTPITEVEDLSDHWVHSRVPLTEAGDADAVVGLVHRRDVFDALLEHANRRGEEEEPAAPRLRDLMVPIRFVPETMRANELLDLFIAERTHLVAVADEYGGFEGVVTLEDVLECLLGTEIVDEYDAVENLQELARRQGRVDAAGAEPSA